MAIQLRRYSAQVAKLQHSRIEDALSRAFEGREDALPCVLRDIRISCAAFVEQKARRDAPLEKQFLMAHRRHQKHLQRGPRVLEECRSWLITVDRERRPDLSRKVESLFVDLCALEEAIGAPAIRRRRHRPTDSNVWQLAWNIAVAIDNAGGQLTAYRLNRVLAASDSPLAGETDRREIAKKVTLLLQDMRRLNPAAALYADWDRIDDPGVQSLCMPPTLGSIWIVVRTADNAVHPRPWTPFEE